MRPSCKGSGAPHLKVCSPVPGQSAHTAWVRIPSDRLLGVHSTPSKTRGGHPTEVRFRLKCKYLHEQPCGLSIHSSAQSPPTRNEGFARKSRTVHSNPAVQTPSLHKAAQMIDGHPRLGRRRGGHFGLRLHFRVEVSRAHALSLFKAFKMCLPCEELFN